MNYTDKEIIEIREIEYYLNNLEKIKEELRIASDLFKKSQNK